MAPVLCTPSGVYATGVVMHCRTELVLEICGFEFWP
jgi:hypothetical protein